MKVLVTGSTGFIGGALCQALAAQGHVVRAFHRPNSSLRRLEGLDVEHAQGDLTQPATLEAACAGMEVVFHAAAWMGGSEVGRLYAVTVEGTRAVLQAAQRAGVRRVIHTSSVAALGVPPPGEMSLIDEHHTWNFRPERYPYGYAKYLAELEVQKSVAQGLDAVILNPSLVYGAGDVHRGSTSIIQRVAQRQVGVTMAGGINVVHIDDVVEGHLRALEVGRTGERYILSGENLEFTVLLQQIARITGVPGKFIELPGALVRGLRAPASFLERFIDFPVSAELFVMAGRYLYYDRGKACRELGLPAPRSTEQALNESYAWFRQV